MTRFRSIITPLLLACATVAHAQPATTDKPAPQPEPALIVRELLVLQSDRYDDTANNPKLVSTTLFSPIIHQGRLKRVDAAGDYEKEPMPLGFITFQGKIAEPMKLRLTLDAGRDRFHAHWPNNAIIGGQFIQWRGLLAADDAMRAVPIQDPKGWLTALREGEDRVWLRSPDGQSKERFLLYDVSLRFKPAIDLTLDADQYRLATRAPEQAAPPISILVRKSDAGWTSDALAAPWPSPSAAIAKKPSTATPDPDLNQALGPIKDLLTQRGYNNQEIKLALSMIASAGFDQSNLALVYVLPVGTIDQSVRLQIKPTPDKLIRTTIVVINNVDPDLGSYVNALLDDLGSEQWLKRDRAHRELMSLGQAAIGKVQQLKNNKDPEVAFRARQILDAYDLLMGVEK